MGVINITPNSFSDGGKFTTPTDVLAEINKMSPDIVDIGAESTAPFNDPIGQQEELNRLKKYLYPIIDQIKGPISIDTYRLETIDQLVKDFSRPLIWNDVSGCDFERVCEMLKKHPQMSYVYSHNLVPERSKTSDHMNYVDQNLKIDDLIQYFNKVKKLPQELADRFYLDPCFGFAKTREQNFKIFKALPQLFAEFQNFKWLLGISRKSFLRFSQLPKNDPRLIAETEVVQTILFDWLFRLSHGQDITIRMHNAEVFQIWQQLFAQS